MAKWAGRRMLPFSQYLPAVCGRAFGADDLVVIFSTHLDETGTDGRSPYIIVAGAVSTLQNWEKLEDSWGNLLARSGVSAYHWQEFDSGSGDFSGWSRPKLKRFVNAQEKIIAKNTIFRISVGADDKIRAEVKERMMGIKGFRPDSSYGLCFRVLMFNTCNYLIKLYPDFRLSILIESGPWASGAVETFCNVRNMRAEWNPAKHARRLEVISVARKGERRSLEAADYIAGSERVRLVTGKRIPRGAPTLASLLDAKFFEKWYEGMIKAKEFRRAHWERQTDED